MIVTFTLEITDEWIGAKIVRFADDSDIGWAYDGEGQRVEGVNIWNQTDDIVLYGQSGDIHFLVH